MSRQQWSLTKSQRRRLNALANGPLINAIGRPRPYFRRLKPYEHLPENEADRQQCDISEPVPFDDPIPF